MRGATPWYTSPVSTRTRFQSTLPMRGATVPKSISHIFANISIHAPHAGSDFLPMILINSSRISIHAPHAGSDGTYPQYWQGMAGFQSTLPMRGATPYWVCRLDSSRFQSTLPMRGATALTRALHKERTISIHAPHAGSDGVRLSSMIMNFISIHAPHAGSDNIRIKIFKVYVYFNPRSPCGERLPRC